MILNYKKFNPLAFYLLMFMQDKTIRNIIMFGGSSSGIVRVFFTSGSGVASYQMTVDVVQ